MPKIENFGENKEHLEIENHARMVLKNLGLRFEDLRSKKVLDLGAGKAELAQWAKQQGINIMCLDNFSGYERDVSQNLDYVEGQADKLPFSDESLDLILSHGSPPGIAQDREEVIRIIKEVKRALKKNGEFRFGPRYLHPAIFKEGELFTPGEENTFSTEDRMKRIREKSLQFLRSIFSNIAEVPIKGEGKEIDRFYYLSRK